MELKDNFTNRYFKPELVKSQIDMIKEPTATDALAEGFQKYKDLPTKNAYAELDNMTMAGIGDGMKAVANDKRQEQIDPILKMTGQINAQNAYLEAQMQEDQQETMKTQQFVKDQSFSFMELSKAIAAGDTGAANNIARGILQSYKSTSGDPIVGDFDHYHDGNIYYTNNETGEKSALSIPLLLNKSEIAPELFGADYGSVMSSYSTGFKGQYENEMALQQQKLEKGEADIRNTNSQADYLNAQSTHLGMQDRKIDNEIANPPLTPAQAKTKELNEGRFSKRTDEAEDKRVLNNAYEQYIENIEEAKKKGLTGKSKLAEWKRYWAEKTGNSENMDVEEMLRITHANRVKELGGSNANQRQFEVAMASAPSITKDPDATIKFLDKIIEQNNEYLNETDHLGQKWESSNWQGQERSILNDYRSKHQSNTKRNNRNQGNSDMVQVRSPSGKIGMIPRSALSQATGYEIVE